MNDELRRSSAHVFVDDLDSCLLSTDDVRHLGAVLRLRDGEHVTASDGAGRWRPCSWVAGALVVDGDIRIEERNEPILTVAVAPLKGDRTEWVVEKLVELGIDEVVVLAATDHSTVRWQSSKTDHVMSRYRRVAVAAAMQSRRVFLPQVSGPHPMSTLMLPGTGLAEPGGTSRPESVTTLIIGPEGGFSAAEVAAAPCLVDLGPSILRADTAALVGATLMVAHRARSMRHTEMSWPT